MNSLVLWNSSWIVQTKIEDEMYKQLCTIIMQKYANVYHSDDGNVNLMFQ